MTQQQRERLEPVRIGLGGQDGYSGGDLTSARTVAIADEVAYLAVAPDDAPDSAAPDVIELRIHGVGGAPATDNLESPAVVQVAGDANAGFYRAWYPGGHPPPGTPRREAYSWGELDYKSASSALWVMLLPFGFLNVAHWALPATRLARLQPVSRAWLRLLALVLTAAYVATTSYLLVDLLAWQAARKNHLWTWLHFYTDRALGPKTAIAMLAVFAVIAALWALSRHTAGKYERKPSGFGAANDPTWRLSRTTFWCGERTLIRQRYAHLTVSAAVVLFVITRPQSSAMGLREACAWAAAALAAAAAVLVLSPWTDRVTSAGSHEPESLGTHLAQTLAFGSLAVALAATVSRFWWRPLKYEVTIPWETTLQVWLPIVEFGIVIVLFALIWLQRPATVGDVMGGGYAAGALALLGTLVSIIFSGALILAAANLLAKPTPTKVQIQAAHQQDVLVVPTSVYAGALGLVAAMASLLGVGVFLYLAWRRRRAVDRAAIPGWYTAAGRAAPVPPVPAAETERATRDRLRFEERPYEKTTDQIARTWAMSELTDYAAVILFSLTLPTAAVYGAYQLALAHFTPWSWLSATAGVGAMLGVAAVGLLVAYLRQAIVNVAQRKRLGFFWDVLTFWPRAVHPFGPTSYGERSIPEVVTRIRRLVGGYVDDITFDPAVAIQQAELASAGPPVDAPPGAPAATLVEQHSPLLLVGYSQGTPIAVAVVAQLPPEVRARVGLLTLAAPVRRLYGRAFPAYFGPDQLQRMRDELSDPVQDPAVHGAKTSAGIVRWRNLVRRSDYIGGWALAPLEKASDVDREIFDPPVLTLDTDPAPPPTHLHSDWFPDPQNRACARELRGMLR